MFFHVIYPFPLVVNLSKVKLTSFQIAVESHWFRHQVNGGAGLPLNFPFITLPPQTVTVFPTGATQAPAIDPRINNAFNALLNTRFNSVNSSDNNPQQQQEPQPRIGAITFARWKDERENGKRDGIKSWLNSRKTLSFILSFLSPVFFFFFFWTCWEERRFIVE